ncbi:high-affinity branched-chain amino acid ABC transporter permease LivM [Shumkonia mesophila]|uniref:high-affinity branched-chain amino acid ABC transporter permease LivM n=1 Tax=Shumkonia mesophila TaxID=2838854 RepID=UPI0029344D59|nr:high-affinity branched-chain amino acid ABC transporter permease LivM [Shumkonia mesophila]
MQGLKKSLLTAVWFMFLTFPIMVIRVDTIEKTIVWRWENLALVGISAFLLSYVWRFFMTRRQMGGSKQGASSAAADRAQALQTLIEDRRVRYSLIAAFAIFVAVFPFLFSMYQVNIMISALIYIMLGLGLNIVVGLAGLLDLGFVAFYAVGAYAYALLNLHFGLGFWAVLPMAAFLGAFVGILLGFPVLRLRGDYLAIVTLGFGEIIRLVLENWGQFTRGPSGISNIPRPDLFGVEFGLQGRIIYMYYVVLALVLFTILVVTRLKYSRIGRAWMALREDEIACQAMGIDKTQTKLMAFALGATWAAMAGVVFAAKTSFINPASFTFLESAMILSIVVLGGMGSTVGVIMGALILILLPEYLRAFAEYRMIVFGAIMVVFMVFRPQGLIRDRRLKRRFHPSETRGVEAAPSGEAVARGVGSHG